MMAARLRLDDDRLRELRQLLGEARGRLLRTVAVTDVELGGLSALESGELGEESARRTVAELLGRLEGRELHELDEIEAATARLETGSFGVCHACGAAIALSRLRAMPWARHCLGCQAYEERRP
jgi:DnaK suppressor protein